MGMPQLVEGAVFATDYRIVRALAEGGMGAVYVAEQISTGRTRALKVLHPQMCGDARSRERFAQEARIGARIRSEHVVEVVGAGVDETTGVPWLAMELLEGSDLGAVVAQRGALPQHEVLELIEQACDAIGQAHAAGIVHRDLKPENLFVATSTRRGVPFTLKVLDFGISKLIQESHTAATATSTIGSPLWMAPEQAEHDGKMRPATDTWALGLITFHLLTGRYYWRSANTGQASLTALMKEVLFDALVPPSERAAELACGPLPAGFDAWFARCVARDPNARFANASELVDGLRRVLGGSAANRTVPLAQVASTASVAPAMQPPPARGLPIGLLLGAGAVLAVGVGVFALIATGAFDDGDAPTPPTVAATSVPAAAIPSQAEPPQQPVEPPTAPVPEPTQPSAVVPELAPEPPASGAWQWREGYEETWSGRWSMPGYQYRFVLSLEREAQDAVHGRFRWTRVGVPERGTEWVRGTYDTRQRRLSLRGYRVEGQVGLDQYRIDVSADGVTLNGTSRTHEGNWSGRLTARRGTGSERAEVSAEPGTQAVRPEPAVVQTVPPEPPAPPAREPARTEPPAPVSQPVRACSGSFCAISVEPGRTADATCARRCAQEGRALARVDRCDACDCVHPYTGSYPVDVWCTALRPNPNGWPGAYGCYCR